ncbi:low molecular weight protein arginine phosphatase [Paenibacillus sambharensis]|uniref:Low molecular weight protein arginine phosphatase n=1 Tax=Paenibacillus sambharensis TaxID=1803190 RepID=A0A2W1M1I5_9BACL|nr:low molecular weight protein arginine phosphatase [Paenibacillus sambharensis]PZD97771.1 low molecular weight protein arginine phosphatase [Paenibacillus sambharensis]
MIRILFVCTGNTCRSPMAEALLRERAKARGIEVEVRSAGVSTVDGLPVSPHAAETLRARNITHAGSSHAVTGQLIDWADLILAMTTSHKRNLIERFPVAVEKTHTLMEYVEDRKDVMSDISELERLYSEWQVKQVLGEQLSDEERARLLQLEQQIPSFDIADPFGGSLERYRQVADELTGAVDKLLDKLLLGMGHRAKND